VSGAVPPFFPELIRTALNPVGIGILAIAMILTRELYPYWRPGLGRAIFDLVLVALGLLLVIFVALRMVALI